MVAHALPTASSHPMRAFGRFELRRLLGKSTGSMVWLAFDPKAGGELVLALPRVAPLDAAALDRWAFDVRRASGLDHPNLARVAEIGAHEHWPFVAVDRQQGVGLDEWLALHPNPTPVQAVSWVCELLHGLAFAHDAGTAHGDLQRTSLLIDDRGRARVMGLAVASAPTRRAGIAPSKLRATDDEPDALRGQRGAAARDVLACGLLLHHLLVGAPALDEPDLARAIDRMTPEGREQVRLPWSTSRPLPESLRAIVNRCTAGQERLRYQNARTLLRALGGWLEAQSAGGHGPIERLLDRLHSVGHLPALPGLAVRVSRITQAEGQRTEQIADQVLDDLALTFELLRTLNSAHVQGTQVQGNGPVLTLRRIVSLIGVNGVRHAANTLRPWPGPLAPAQAEALQTEFDRVRLAARLAQALRPKGYDAQVVYLITALQNLGALVLHYHFADEAGQMRRLMQPAIADRGAGIADQPGLSESAAAFAVLGVDTPALGAAVAQHWRLGDDVMQMARRVLPDAVVRKPETDAEVLRLTASAANEVADATFGHDAAHAAAAIAPAIALAIAHVAQRYGRALGISVREITDALQAARPVPAERNARR